MLATAAAPPTMLKPFGVASMSDELSVMRNRAIIRSITDTLSAFRDLSPTMTVGEVIMFLQVALNEGESQTELAERASIAKPSASRYLLGLSDKRNRGAGGLGLIQGDVDPSELRRKVYSLTPKGRTLMQRLVAGAKPNANLS